MTPEDRKQMLAAAEHIRRCDEADAKREVSPAAPPAEALGLFIFAVERLFKEASDWTKSCTSTSNWFDHNPAAQALKALLEQYKRPAAQEPLVQQPQAQEPRLTLGRVPVGGPGTYVVWERESVPGFFIWDGKTWENTHPCRFESAFGGWEEIEGSFGPIPSHDSVSKAWEAAGRPV